MRKKEKKKTITCDKSTLTFEVGIAHCDNGIVICEKKKKKTMVQPNMAKV